MATGSKTYAPPLFTLLVFMLSQGLGSALLFVVGSLCAPKFLVPLSSSPVDGVQENLLHDFLPVAFFAFLAMSVNVVAVWVCTYWLHYIHPRSAFCCSSVRWPLSLFAICGGVAGAISLTILTDSLDAPDAMRKTALAMSHNVWGVLAMAVVGPVAEELLFREAIVGEMLRRGAAPHVAVLTSAVAFSAAHLNLAQGLYALPLGIIFGVIYCRTGNVVLTSLLHILNNSIVAVLLIKYGEEAMEISLVDEFASPTVAYAFSVLLAVLCIVSMIAFWRAGKPCPQVDCEANRPTR